MNLNLLNKQKNKYRFGILIRYYRHINQYSLRSLASLVGISHAYLSQIEIGKATISKRTFDYLISALDIKPHYDSEAEKQFYAVFDKVINNLFYFNLKQLNETISTQKKLKKHHEYTLWEFDYQLMMLFYHSMQPKIDLLTLNKSYHQLVQVESLLYDYQKIILKISYANIKYHAYDIDSVIETLEKALELKPKDNYIALIYYLLGLAYGEIYKLMRSNHYLDLAIEHFKRQNNDLRLKFTYIFKTFNYVKIGNRHMIEQSLNEALTFSQYYNLKQLEALAFKHFVIYYLKMDKTREAIRFLDYWQGESYEYCFFDILVRLKHKANQKQLLKRLKEHEKKRMLQTPKQLIYVYGLAFLKSHIAQPPKQQEQHLKAFFCETIKAKKYFEVSVAYDYYQAFLVRQRRYKDALEITEKIIDISKKAYD